MAAVELMIAALRQAETRDADHYIRYFGLGKVDAG